MAKYTIASVAAIMAFLNSSKATALDLGLFWFVIVGLFAALDDLVAYAYGLARKRTHGL